MPPIVKKINEHRTVIIYDETIGDLKCYKCFKRSARLSMHHYNRCDYLVLDPQLVEWGPGYEVTQWCLECLLRCQNLEEETLIYIKNSFSQCPSNKDLDSLTQIEEAEKKRDLEEQQCCCQRHLRLCCEQTESTQDEIREKYHEFFLIEPDNHEEIGKWLLWVGDNEERYKKMYDVVVTNYDADWIVKNELLKMISFAWVFGVRTRCHHHLPKPYSHCTCNFSMSHHQRLIDDLKDLKILGTFRKR